MPSTGFRNAKNQSTPPAGRIKKWEFIDLVRDCAVCRKSRPRLWIKGVIPRHVMSLFSDQSVFQNETLSNNVGKTPLIRWRKIEAPCLDDTWAEEDCF